MESVHQQFNSTQAVEPSSVLIGSPLPATNFIQLPSSALMPLGSSSAFGSILSVPVISHSLVSPVKQPQPMQSQPLLLLPASALSLSAQTNCLVSTPYFNSGIQSSSIEQNQQLHLNNTQIPVILKSPDSSLHIEQSLNAQQINQQLLILPVEEGSRELTQDSDGDILSRQTSSGRNILGNTKNLKIAKNLLHGKPTAAQSKADKSEPQKPGMKTRSVKTRDMSGSVVASPVVTSADRQRDKIDIAQIISSIPPGWQVVGVTGPNQMLFGDLSSSFSCLSPVSSVLAGKPTTSAAEAHCEVKGDGGLLTNKFLSHDQPGLVSVNLNTSSQPVASETVLEKWSVNELTCSVKMDDIPCTPMISIKTESSDGSEGISAAAISGSNFDRQTFNHVKPANSSESLTNAASGNTGANKQLQEPGVKTIIDAYIVPENKTVLHELSNIQQSFSSPCAQTIPTESQWTIIGITSISPLLPTNTVTTSQAPMSVVELPTNKGENLESTQRKSAASDATILKIPLCSSSVSVAKKDRNTQASKRRSALRPRVSSSTPSANDDRNRLSLTPDIPGLTKPEDIKWTVVGIVGSPLPSSSTLNPCIASASEYLNTSNQVNSARIEEVMSSQLVNVLSPLLTTDTSTILLSASPSPNQFSPSGESSKKSKSQEAETSSSDDLKLDHPNSPNQWKVVGVTQLGIPFTAASPVLPVPQRSPISPIMSMPFLIPTPSGSPFSSYATETSGILTHPTGTSQSSRLLSSLTSPSLLASSALQLPVLNIGNAACSSGLTVPSTNSFLNISSASCSSALTVPSATSLLNTASPVNMPVLQDLAQHQNLNQIIQGQLPSCQNMLTLRDTNQWNVVGVVANNQVSLLQSNQSGSPLVTTMTPVSTTSVETFPAHSSPPTPTQNIQSKQFSSSNDANKAIQETAAVRNVSIRQSLVSKFEESNGKKCHLKCKDMVKKQQESAKIKKNTVSNLLRIKRMQQRTSDNGSSEEGDQSIEDYPDVSNASYEVPEKKTKIRSLRSYAGNRKIFTRAQNKTPNEKISLKRGPQVSALSCKSENDDDDDGAANLLVNSKEEKVADTLIPVQEMCDDKITLTLVETHSSSRRRKLKVPRKLVADLDYYPFDSSSDSN